MRTCIILLLFIHPFSFRIFAGNEIFSAGSSSAAMGNASVTNFGFWSAFHNQAGLSSMKNLTLGFHHENRFNVPELSLHSFGIALPTKPGTLAFNFSYFGFSKYNEIKAGLSFGRFLWENFAVGIQLNYLHTHIDNLYGNTGTLVVEGGFIANPFPDFFIGAHVYNPTRSKIGTFYDQPLPVILRLGIGYHFGNRAIVTVETEKDLYQKAIFKAGTEINVLENFVIRSGIAAKPSRASFGVGYVFRNLTVDMAFTNHQVLGLTPHVSISYAFR